MWVKIPDPEPILDNETLMNIPFDRKLMNKLKKMRRPKYFIDYPRKRSKSLYTKV